MTERSFAEFLAALEQTAAEDDEDERTLLTAGLTKAVRSVARTIIDRPEQTPTAEPRPKFCRQCGAQLKPEGRFCTKCGATIVA